jgi:hypothetical protein
MASSKIKTFLWLSVLGVSFAAFWLFAKQEENAMADFAGDSDNPHDYLIAPSQGRLTAVRVGDILVRRQSGQWRYSATSTEPPVNFTDKTEDEFIADRVQLLRAARIERRIDSTLDDQGNHPKFGVNPGSLVIALSFGGQPNAEITLRIGSSTPDGFAHYFWLEPTGVLVTLPSYQLQNLVRLAAGQ